MMNLGVQFRVLLVALALGVLVTGLVRLPDARRDVYPEFSPPIVEIQTEALGLSAAEVEQLVTVPLEADLLNGVAWVDDIRSESVLGLSSITMVFKPGTDLYRARQAVQERLAQAHALPQVSKPPQMLQPTSSTGRVMMVGLTSDKLSLIEMSELARWTVKPRLEGVHGVANVATFGQRDRQLQVQVDPKRLHDAGVSLQQVISTTGNSLWVSPLTFLEASSPGTGGFIESQNQRLTVRHVSPIESSADLAKVAVEDKPGVVLGDVATVVEDHQPLIGDALIDGKPGLLLVIAKLPGANTVEVTDGVHNALRELAPAMASINVNENLYRPADYVRRGADNLGIGMAAGLLAMMVLLAFLLYAWRSALIAIVSVLVAVLGAALVLTALGQTLNWMVLTGLAAALGIVVDDAVGSAERTVRTLREDAGSSTHPPVGTALLASLGQLRTSLSFATVVAVLPVLPVFFIGHRVGYFGRPLALAYLVSVGVSMLVALLLAPALAVLLYRRGPLTGIGSPLMQRLSRPYDRALARTLSAPRRVLAVAGVIAVASAVFVPQVLRSELPALKESDYVIELDAPPGTSLPEMTRITAQLSDELKIVPGVRAVASHAGRAVAGDEVVNVDKAEMSVSLDRDADQGESVRGLQDVLARYRNYDADLMSYQSFALKEADDQRDDPILVRLSGHDQQVLADRAKEFGAKIGQIRGVTNLQVDLPVNQRTLEVQVDLAKAAQYGVKPGDVRRAAATLIAGIEVGSLFYDQKVFSVVVWGTPDIRKNIADVENLEIATPHDGLVPLNTLAAVRQVDSPDVIERAGAFRKIDISADVSGRSRGAVAADVRRLISGTPLPLETHAALLGGYVEKKGEEHRLLMLAGFALLATLLLLQACFGSWRLGALVFATIPAAISGGLLAAVLVDGGTIGTTTGLLVVFGLAVRSAVVLVRRCQHLRRREGVEFSRDLVARVGQERFAPTLLSVLATAAVFAPFVVVGDVAGGEILQPMAIVVLCGTVTVLAVSLLIV